MSEATVEAPGARMRAEIAEQPDRWLDLLEGGSVALDAAAELLRRTEPELIVFIARGTSDHAAQYAQYLVHNALGVPAMLATPSTSTVYRRQLRQPSSVALAISQSGESPDLLAAVRDVRSAGRPVIGLTNNVDSSLAAIADAVVPLHAGAETSVAATKTYTAELLALYCIIRRVGGASWAELSSSVRAVAERARGIIADELAGPGLLGSFADHDRALIIGRGYGMSTAKEGALKLMETSRIAASGWSAADATHGPLGQVNPGVPIVGVLSDPDAAPSVRGFLTAAGALGAEVRTVEFSGVAPELTPVLDILPLQAAALRTSLAKGLDPDRPDGLAKVTRTT